jgi:hypothetical protein
VEALTFQCEKNTLDKFWRAAMTILVTYACEVCGTKFEYLHHPSIEEDPGPDECPSCHASFAEVPEPEPVNRLNMGNSLTAQSVDKVYRDLEEGSAARAEAAGDPSLKITNMKDHLREGDVAVDMPSNTITNYAQQTQHQYWQGSQIAGTLAQAKSGPGAGNKSGGAFALAGIQQSRMGLLR